MKNPTERLPKDLLKWTAAGFALVATATAEYEIARAIGMNEWIAAAVPGALDAYVVRALRTHREVLTSVVAMVGVNAASHLVTAGILPVEWPLITAVSAIAPLVLWRVHALGTPGEARRRVLWGMPWRARTAGHTSTEPEHTEHDRAPDNPEPPGTREHPEVCYCGAEVWGDLGAHQRAPGHPAREHTASTDQARVRAQTDAWGDDWLDVHDAVHAPSTPPVPVHAPYADHVLTPSTRHPRLVHDGFDSVHAAEHAPDPVCPACKHDVHTALACDSAFCDCVHNALDREHGGAYEPEHAAPNGTRLLKVVHADEHTASTPRTADDWNLEHVSTGVLTPEDTEHMERARELFHTIGGVPSFRALKHGTPSMGTPRATRLRAALKIENEGTD